MAYYMVYLVLTLFLELGAMIAIFFVASDKAKREKAERKKKMHAHNEKKAAEREQREREQEAKKSQK